MDIGAASDGSQVFFKGTNGDLFDLHFELPVGTNATNLGVSIPLPTGITYVDSSAKVVNSLQSVLFPVVVTLNSQLLSFNFTTTGPSTISFDLIFKLYADLSAVPGDNILTATVQGTKLTTKTVNFPVFTVDSPSVGIGLTPLDQALLFGSTVSWTITASNPGLGGAFNVTLSEANIGVGLQLLSMTPIPPLVPSATTTNSITIPYIASQGKYSITVL